MVKVSPSVLACDLSRLHDEVESIKMAGADMVHLDVMDGIFVTNISFGLPVIASLRKGSDMFFDVHLMIDKPIRYVDEFCKAGADYLTVHIEADTPENIDKTLDKIAALGVKPGIVVKPKTGLDAIKPYLTKCALVLVMTVEPGFGGQKFMQDMMPKLREIRDELDRVNPECHLEVDGGVDLVTAEICKANGADVLVAGSAFYKAEDKAAFRAAIEK